MAAKKLLVKVGPEGTAPERDDSTAWHSIRASKDICIWPEDREDVETDLTVEIPAGCVGLLTGTMEAAAERGLELVGGMTMMAPGGPAPLRFKMVNRGRGPQWIRKGDRVARLLLIGHQATKAEVVKGFQEDPAPDSAADIEDLLRRYSAVKMATSMGSETAKKQLERIGKILRIIEGDPYRDIIEMYYIKGYTREYIAEKLDTSVTTVSRQKTRLLQLIADTIGNDVD